jgi:hypothetical protein
MHTTKTSPYVDGEGRSFGLDHLFLLCSNYAMTDRPASWRMPTPKQMEKPATLVGRRTAVARPLGPSDEMPPEYWNALLSDACPDARPSGPSIRMQRLSKIPWHVLRVSCRRCQRIVEIQKTDAIRLYGAQAIWKEVGQRLLDDTCQRRTGRHEEDGCWPGFDMP